jgi:hypothetical protein
MENLLESALKTASSVLALSDATLKKQCAAKLRKNLHLFKRLGYVVATASEAVSLGFMTNVLPSYRMDKTESMVWALHYSPCSNLGKRKIAAYPLCRVEELPAPVIKPSYDQIAQLENLLYSNKEHYAAYEEHGDYDMAEIHQGRIDGVEAALRILGIEVEGMQNMVES